MTWEMAKDATKDGRQKLGDGIAALIGKVQDATGLKLKEGLGLSREAVAQAEANAREAVAVVEQKGEAAREAVEKRVEEAKVATEKKATEVKEVVEKKVEEVRRLV